MLRIYGTASSRANRCLWMLEEMGQPYELVEKSSHPDDPRTAEYLRLNPRPSRAGSHHVLRINPSGLK